MEYRTLGASGLRVSALTLGTMTFGGKGGFAAVGSTGVAEARRVKRVNRVRGDGGRDEGVAPERPDECVGTGQAFSGRLDKLDQR